ncbi:fimbria/pilus outer membrane usher protein [Xanthomonas theicola]|uniref:Fimbriae usher protein n=1 Tax=Xanthomonas theicola TaxID=56464 RepID=A0A2S6ZML2_9XANT|nr:fimbriae usher protein [Xanthomonas theicola]QNH25540.1 fimbrial biogenesis outer membrane usher protein [Xanthomonas theicola]
MLAALASPPLSCRADATDAGEPPTPAPAAPEPQTLYLDVAVNRTDRGLAPFELRAGTLRATVATLRQLGFTLAARAPADWIALETLQNVDVRYDAALQQISLQAPLEQLSLPTTVLKAADEETPPASASPGVLLNYDLYATRTQTSSNVALTAELRAFGSGPGLFTSTLVLRGGERHHDSRLHGESVRLDSAWQLDFPESAVSLSVGDFYTGFVDWSRSVRLGGVQVGSNYGLQPYRMLTPTPTFLGEAVVPSTVELYVDGLRQYNGEAPVGPFQLAAQPGISGNGNARIVVTDAFGRVRTLDFAFYGTQQLLAKGVTDWSAGIGHLRKDYGVRSFAYESELVASATQRRGVREDCTYELHAEGGGGVATAGVGGLWQLGNAGVVNLAYAHGRMGARQGGQYTLGYSWNNRHVNASVNTQRAQDGYRDLGALQGALPVRASDSAVLGVNFTRFGSLGVSYVRLSYPHVDSTRYASLFWSQTFRGHWSANLSLNQNLHTGADRSLYFSLSTSLGQSRQASAAIQRNGPRTSMVADLSQPLPGDGEVGGVGWRVQASAGNDSNGGLAEIGWLNRVGRYAFGAASRGDTQYGYASASGSLVWMQGHTFAARDIADAFALVSTDGYAEVPVRLENRPIGVTDRNGILLVTPLQSWQRNRLSIDALDLPADLRVDRVEASVTPRQHSGLQVRFGLQRIRAATVVLQDAQGRALALGSTVRVHGQDAPPAVVGYDGETFLDNLQPHNRLDVVTPDGPCRAEFDYPDASAPLPRVGPLACRPEPAP